jgi:hypothetical protein
MDSSAHPLDSLRAFRGSLYRCFDRRADALFELTDAILTAGSVPSPVHLSLAAVHRRGWGMGQPLRRFEQRTNRRRKLTGLALSAPPRRRKPGRSPKLRRGRLGVVPLRRRDEPGAGVLLPPV